MIGSMIFAFATDDRTLFVFPNEAKACSYAEGIDVEDGVWLFFAEDGTPLVPAFATAPAGLAVSGFGPINSNTVRWSSSGRNGLARKAKSAARWRTKLVLPDINRNRVSSRW